MSLKAAVAALDEAALAALASAGLLRRARAAKLDALRVEGDSAHAEIGGHRVEIGAKGIKTARCSCPATGLCLHVLAAVLALRAETGEEAAAPPSAEAALLALPESALAAFAGADWGPALNLARRAEAAEVSASEGSARVVLADLPHPVTFLAGGGLRGAIWKGAEGRRRLAVAAAALALRRSRGVEPRAEPESVSAAPEDALLFAQAGREIEAALPALLNGGGALALDRLTDLALSARIAGAPRPAGALASLVRTAARVEARGFGDLLTAAARTRALLHALTRRPGDPRLRGVLRRRYAPSGPLSLWILGARVWESESGARGLRIHAYDPGAARWLTAGPARPGGLDPRFDPRARYRLPALGAASVAEAMGRRLDLASAGASEDGILAPEAEGALQPVSAAPDLPVFSDWAQAAVHLEARFGPPLTRGRVFAPILLQPASVGSARRDPKTGEITAPLRDAHGRRLPLLLDRSGHAADRLSERRRDPPLLLAEASEPGRRLHLALIATLETQPRLRVWNPELDCAPIRRGEAWAAGFAPPEPPSAEPLEAFAAELLAAAEAMALGRPPDPALAAQAEALGLAALAATLSAAPGPEAALRLVWRAAEWERRLRLSAAQAAPP